MVRRVFILIKNYDKIWKNFRKIRDRNDEWDSKRREYLSSVYHESQVSMNTKYSPSKKNGKNFQKTKRSRISLFGFFRKKINTNIKIYFLEKFLYEMMILILPEWVAVWWKNKKWTLVAHLYLFPISRKMIRIRK